jgi:hypothetical protein
MCSRLPGNPILEALQFMNTPLLHMKPEVFSAQRCSDLGPTLALEETPSPVITIIVMQPPFMPHGAP